MLFERVYVPKRVRQEVSKKRALKDRLNSTLRRLSLYRKCNIADPVRVEFLLQERKKRRALKRPNADRGEAEAVIQAQEIDASMVVMDDKTGRKWADNHGID